MCLLSGLKMEAAGPVFVPNLLSETASCPAVITADVTGHSVLLNAVRTKGIESQSLYQQQIGQS